MIAILTTKTTHHVFFENQIFKKYKDIINVYETTFIQPKFKINTIFEKKREIFEKKICFQNKKFNFKGKSYAIKNINDNIIFKILKKHNIKYLIVFGTRKIKKEIVNRYKNKIFNLHGGNPEEFRGLDSHYWSIYHNFNLYSCLHKLSYKLDDGNIVFLKKIKLQKNMKIHQLRFKNTLYCIQMVLRLIYLIKNNKTIPTLKQKNESRYYSFMPKAIKDIVEKKFNLVLKNY